MVSEARWWQIGGRVGIPPAQRHTLRLVALSATAGLLVAAGAVAAAGPWEGGQRRAERERAAAVAAHADSPHAPSVTPGTPPVLAALGDGAGSPPARAGLAAVLDPLLRDPALGAQAAGVVYDAATGQRLYGSGQDGAYTPASTVKLATAAAALTALGPDHRIETTAVREGDTVVLVGGGDPTLTARPANGAGPRPASLADLADATARALKADGKDHVRLAYDTSRYTGPTQHTIGPNDNIAPVTALMADEGRLDASDHGPADRTADPAGDAARAFAALLRERGVSCEGEPAEGRAPAGARPLAAVSSPPLSALVERALTTSDNDIAEALARQTALASGRPASFEGAAQAVTERLRQLGLPLDGARIADGSGLDRADALSPDLLARLLALAADPRRPALRPLLTGLPVAGFSGTLRGRYGDGAAGRGLVRAKTGTLTRVNTLAGTAVDADGRLLAFAFMANGTTDADGAQRALDRMASAVAACGCRG
ncbi:D-alanyl-D-alanine carboxypeptidase/D-alanyl-D-alanine-endopeptidase [Streptomyces gamaensis]|uniref:D-alanyl-D-alanine carboxypeptidase/D-alanyl-D-alanine-endopeptidase n=1 Tax=Streptomyces gamaensis TaxID=1763542 RepID=A0ABW0Z9J1_9ACTN